MNYPTWNVGDRCQRMNGHNKSIGIVESVEEMAGVRYVTVRWHNTGALCVMRADRIAHDDRPRKEAAQ